jgi:hypothetical protein
MRYGDQIVVRNIHGEHVTLRLLRINRHSVRAVAPGQRAVTVAAKNVLYVIPQRNTYPTEGAIL